MFQNIFQYIEKSFKPNNIEKDELFTFFKSMEDSTDKLQEKLKQIGNRYNFENLNNTAHTLFFWRENFQLPLSIALDDEDIDDDFTFFINEDDIYNPIFKLETEGLEEVCFDIYHSWVGFCFQATQLYNCGIPMGITVNSSTTTYYLNDFSYSNYSKIDDIQITDKKVTRPFLRNLTLDEIFIRTHLIQLPCSKIELFSENHEYSEKIELKNTTIKIMRFDLDSDLIINNISKQFEKGNPYNRQENTDINEIINYFESSINKGVKFDLIKCRFEK